MNRVLTGMALLLLSWGGSIRAHAECTESEHAPARQAAFAPPAVQGTDTARWGYGYDSVRIFEVSVNSPAGVPIWPLKLMIPVGAALLTLQGIAEVLRCVQCLKDGRWSPRLHDVEELENQILAQAQAAKGEINLTGAVR